MRTTRACSRGLRCRTESSLRVGWLAGWSRILAFALVLFETRLIWMLTLVLASRINDQLDAIALLVGFQVGGWRPDIGAAVLDFLSDGVERLDVLGGAAEQEDGDGALGGRVPRDGVRLAGRDDIAEAGVENWVALGVANRSGVGGDLREARQAGGEEGEDGEIGLHFDYVMVLYF